MMSAALERCTEGARVKLSNKDGEEWEGKVVKKSRDSLRLVDVTVDGVKQPGIEDIDFEDIAALEVVSSVAAAASIPPEELPKLRRSKKSMISGTRSGQGDVSHLNRLHQLRIDEILAQVQVEDPPEEHVISQQKFSPVVIPVPEQDAEHMEGDKYQGRLNFEFQDIRRRIPWPDPVNTPPQLDLPTKYYTVRTAACFAETLDQIMDGLRHNKAIKVGVSLQGRFLSRLGQVSLVCLATDSAVYLFDVVALGPDACFTDERQQPNLRTVLQHKAIQKVACDFRGANDLLFHQFGVRVANLTDLTAGHATLFAMTTGSGHLPKYAPSCAHLARVYLGVKGAHLYLPKYRLSHLDQDTAVWMERPMTKVLEINAVRDTMYLLEVHRCQAQAIQSFVNRGTDVMLRDFKDVDENLLKIKIYGSEGNPYPPELERQIPDLRINEQSKMHLSRLGFFPEGKFVHNNPGQIDPNVIFSRDVMHQKRKPQLFKFNL